MSLRSKLNKLFDRNRPYEYEPYFGPENIMGKIYYDFKTLLNSNFNNVEKEANRIHSLFTSVIIYKNKLLYESFRYLKIQKDDIKKFSKFSEEVEITLLCIASLNGNGYSREEALIKLFESKSQRSIPFILFRLADWVKPIREKAEELFRALLVKENTIYFIQNHKLISWLLKVERSDLSDLHNEIIGLITSEYLNKDEVKKLNEGERFFYYKWLVRKDKLNDQIISEMLNEKYFLIKILVIKNFSMISNRTEVLSKLLSDRSQKVRQGAINLIQENEISEFKNILEKLIFDKSGSVRSKARHLLNITDKRDFPKLYKESIENNRYLIGSLLGLSETSNIADLELIKKHLNSERTKVKNAALLAIYNLDQDTAIEEAYQILENSNPAGTK
jgi:hypothetical protein